MSVNTWFTRSCVRAAARPCVRPQLRVPAAVLRAEAVSRRGAEVNSENTGTADEDASQEDTSVNVRESNKNVTSSWQTYTFT